MKNKESDELKNFDIFTSFNLLTNNLGLENKFEPDLEVEKLFSKALGSRVEYDFANKNEKQEIVRIILFALTNAYVYKINIKKIFFFAMQKLHAKS